MKNHILLCFIIFAYTNANILVRHNRQLDSRRAHDETSNNWAWGWDDSDDRPITTSTRKPTRKPTRRPTKRPSTTTSSSISSSTVLSTSSTTIPSTISTTPQIISSSTQSPVVVVTPNTVLFNRCIARCIRTPEYNPLCADIGNSVRKQYNNQGEMDCANFCGESSKFLFRGACTAFL